MFFVLEIIVPVGFFGIELVLVLRRPQISGLFNAGITTYIVAGFGVFLSALLYSYILSLFLFSLYRSLSEWRGASNFPYPSWDVGLTYTLSIDLVLLLIVAASIVLRLAISRTRSRSAV